MFPLKEIGKLIIIDYDCDKSNSNMTLIMVEKDFQTATKGSSFKTCSIWYIDQLVLKYFHHSAN